MFPSAYPANPSFNMSSIDDDDGIQAARRDPERLPLAKQEGHDMTVTWFKSLKFALIYIYRVTPPPQKKTSKLSYISTILVGFYLSIFWGLL